MLLALILRDMVTEVLFLSADKLRGKYGRRDVDDAVSGEITVFSFAFEGYTRR